MPPIERNASDIDLEKMLGYLVGPMAAIRTRRRYVEDEWLRNYAAWQGWPSASHFIPLADGSIRYFVPLARRAIERINARVVKLLMPHAKWFEISPFDDTSNEKAEVVDGLFRFIYQKKIKSKRIISALVRSIQLYNFSILHTSPKVFSNNEVWPSQRAVDPFSFYVFPENISDNSEITLMFEDMIIPYEIYNSYTDASNPDNGIALPLDPNKLRSPDWPWHYIERLSYRGLNSPSDYMKGLDDTSRLYEEDFRTKREQTRYTLSQRAAHFVQLTHCHFKLGFSWYKAWFVYNYLEDGDKPEAKIVRLDKVENQPLYQWATVRPLPGEIYNNTPMDDLRVLQILSNNCLSQTESNRAITAEPPVAIDVSGGQSGRTEQYIYKARQKWPIDGKPDDIIKSLDVKDTTASGLRMFQVYSGMITSSSGAGTIAEGQPGRNMPRAGFAVNSLINLALSDMQDIADTIEQELLSYGLADMWHVFNEYVPPNQILKIPGIAGRASNYFTTADLYGDYQFTWIGSLQFQDQQERADRLMKMAELLLNPNVQQILASQNARINAADFITTLWRDALGERNMSQIIVQMSEEEIAFQQAQKAQQLMAGSPAMQAMSANGQNMPGNGQASNGQTMPIQQNGPMVGTATANGQGRNPPSKIS